MKRSRPPHALALLLALVLAGVASPAAAQQDARVRHRELVSSGAPFLYEAIVQTRRDWLPPGAANRIGVFVNGTYKGDASHLQAIVTDSVSAVRWMTVYDVEAAGIRYPAGAFETAVLVSMRGMGARARGRFTASFDVGMSVASMSSPAQRGIDGAGYDENQVSSGGIGPGIKSFKVQGTRIPVVAGATINYRIRDDWGVALTGLHSRGAWAGGYNPDTREAISTTAFSTEGAMLLTADRNGLRLGVGPALQRVDWEWASGWCQCNDKSASSSSFFGAAGEVLMAVPVPGVALRPSMRVFGRYYAEQEVEAGASGERLQVGGFMITIGVGLATVF